ncbi:MAG: TetR/AcrR family transcriptional regulator [Planctomycetota bacterium]|jgi:AcrR family transcriptional regulator
MIAARHYKAFWGRVDTLEAAGLIPAWLHDRQSRSRATRERILRAAERRIRAGSFSETSMQDVADDAGASIGAAYARFPSKESVLAMLGLVVFDAACTAFESALAALPAGARLERIMHAYVHTIVSELSRHRAVVIEVRQHAPRVPELRRLMDHTNQRMHGAFLDRARRCLHEVVTADPDRALRFALFTASAAAREAVLADALRPFDLTPSRDELVTAICRTVMSSLTRA